MANLLRIKEGVVKLPVFPKVTEKDDFRSKFFKMANYLAKTTDVSGVDFVESLGNLLDVDFQEQGYSLMRMDNLHLNDVLEVNARSILTNRAKTSDFSSVYLVYAGEKDYAYAIVPSCPRNIDGTRWAMRQSSTFSKVHIVSIGYLLLGSFLRSTLKVSVEEVTDDPSYAVRNIFDISSKNWKFCRNEIPFYETGLNAFYGIAHNQNLNFKYSVESGKTISTFRTDKKYQDDELNKSSLFTRLGFRKLEVDTERYEKQEFNYEEFALVEKDYEAIHHLLPHASAEAELKFRKLGKHNARGIYSPMLNILAVDVRYTDSFIHEYGHYLDFKHGTRTYSESEDFLTIINLYSKEFRGLVQRDENFGFALKADYYLTPTEIFARGFELWVQATITSNSRLLKPKKIYAIRADYLAFAPFKELVINYFNTIFKKEEQQFQVAADKSVNCEVANKVVNEQLSLF